jgi:signal transduction histidine kinase
MRRGAQEILRTPKPQATLPASQADASGAFIESVEQDKNPAAGSRPQNSRHRKDSVHHGSTEHMLREFLENLPQGVAAFDADHRLFAWNHPFQVILELPDDLVQVGVTWQEMLSFTAHRGDYGPGDPQKLIETTVALLRLGRELNSQLQLKSGQSYEIRSRELPDDGRVFTVNDVTEQRLAEAEIKAQRDALAQSNMTKDKLFSIVAHDLRSPFNTLLGFAQLIADHAERATRQELAEYALEINRSGGRLLQLVDNLLRWSRSQMGDRKFSAKDVALGPVIQRVAELQRQVAAEKGITINTNLPDHVVTIDQDMIEAVLRNLISNAIKFTDQDGAVDVNTRQLDNGRIEISVADSGVGIEDEHLQNLFEFTAETSRNGTHGEPGTGLGLQICAEFAAAHGSEIDVKSTLGEGSSFRFSVPTAE